MDETSELTEPASLLLASRNFYVIVILLQAFLLINGEYLYQISQAAASIYLFLPLSLIFYMLWMTKMENGKPVSWEMLEGSMKGRRDPLSEYLRKAGWSVSYFSVGIQLIYLSLAFMLTFVILLFVVRQGLLEVGEMTAIQARSAIIYTLVLVAPAETMIFHSIIPLWTELTFKKSQYCLYLTYGISQAVFACYHYAAYGGVFQSLIFAFFMGILFLWVCRSYGLPAAIGTHAAWNLVIYGLGQPLGA